MSINERPGVYTSYEISSGLRGSASGGVVGLAAASQNGTANTVVTVTEETAARSTFGTGNMAELASILLANGASAVCCCRVNGTDYESAFAALMEKEEVQFMVCDSRDATVHAKMLAAISGADEKSKYRIGIVETTETAAANLIAKAQAINSERMVLISHCCTSGTTGAAAAAVCGQLAGETDPAIPMNGVVLKEIGAIGANFSDANLNLLVQGGVLPLETMNGKVSIIRGITTKSMTGGVSDATWREVNTIRIVDTVVPTIRDSLRTAFYRAKNTAQTRGAIRTRVIIELERFMQLEIIDGYENVTVAAMANDPTVCEVSFQFQVAHGLNTIQLTAHITV